RDMMFTRDGRFLSTETTRDGQTFTIRRWDAHSAALVAGPHKFAALGAVHAQDAMLMTGDDPTSLFRIRMVDTATMRTVGYLVIHTMFTGLGQVDARETLGVMGMDDGTVALFSFPAVSTHHDDPPWEVGPDEGSHYTIYPAQVYPIGQVAISGDSRVVASATVNARGHIIVQSSASGGRVGESIAHAEPIDGLRLSYDGAYVAAASGRAVRVWSVKSGHRVLGPLVHSRSARAGTGASSGRMNDPVGDVWDTRSLAFSRSANPVLFVRAARDQPVYAYQVSDDTSTTLTEYRQAWYPALAMSDDGSTLATASAPEGGVDFWDTATNERLGEHVPLPKVPLMGNQRLVALSPDGAFAAIRSGPVIQRYTVATGEPYGATFECHISARALAYISGAPSIAVADGDGNTLSIWDATDTTAPARTFELGEEVKHLVVERSGRFIAVAVGTQARFLTPADGADAFPVIESASAVELVALSRDGGRVAIVDEDDVATVWDVAAGARIGSSMHAPHEVVSVRFHPKRDLLLLTYGRRGAQMWDISTGSAYGLPILPPGGVRAAAFSTDGAEVFSVGMAGPVLRQRLPSLPASVDDMSRRTWLATGTRVGATGQVERVPASEWRELRPSLSGQ
ncbi:MAG: WD40 repeat domain-containing protein, partial [Candidatus Poribacteria bacterium]